MQWSQFTFFLSVNFIVRVLNELILEFLSVWQLRFVFRTSLETTSLQPLDSIKTYVKKGEFNTDGFVAKNDSVTVTTQCNCLDGQVLMNTGTTEHCGKWHEQFYKTTSFFL